MRARVNFALDAIAIVVYVIATNPATTGTPVHEWVGVGMAVLVFVHLVSHWDWTVRTLRRFLAEVGRMPRLNLVVDSLLLFAAVTVVLSGLLVSRSVMRPLGWTVADKSIWHAVHSQSATVLLALMGVHLGLHWSWIKSAIRHRIFRPMLDPIGTLAHVRREVVREWELDWRGVSDSFAELGRHALEATLLVALVSACVFALATQSGGRVLVPGLTMPGGAGVGIQAASARELSADSASRSQLAPGDTADSQLVNPTMRAAIRSAHAFLVLIIAMLASAVLGDFAKPRRV